MKYDFLSVGLQGVREIQATLMELSHHVEGSCDGLHGQALLRSSQDVLCSAVGILADVHTSYKKH